MFKYTFLIIRKITHHFLCKFFNFGLSISISCLSIICFYNLNTRWLSIIISITQRSLSFLIFKFNKSFHFLYQELTNFCLAVTGCKVKSSISEFILVINFVFFFFTQTVNAFITTRFCSWEQWCFIKFILNCWFKTP